MRRLFGTDGVRGIANQELTPTLAMQIGAAAATVLSKGNQKDKRVVLGMDTRISSRMLASALSAGLCSAGVSVLDLGVVPTPAVAYLVGKYGAMAGVMISASHNPYDYNGIKVFGGGGFKLPDALEEEIESIVLDDPPAPAVADAEKIGRIAYVKKGAEDYVEHLLGTAAESLAGLRIAIDCANGAASRTAERLFTALGAECHMLADAPDGININRGCGSTHLEALSRHVLAHHMDCGIAFDGDADRCLAVDENGREVDGDIIMAILSKDMKERGVLAKNTVVGTVMSNYGFGKFCEDHGLQFIAAKVGDRYVLEQMQAGGYSFGGEQSGHLIFRDYAATGDGQLTAVQLLSHMSRCKQRLSILASVMKKYPQHTVNLRVSPAAKLAFYTDSTVKEILTEAEGKMNGNGRILVRPSGTEPLLRVMAEGEEEAFVRRLAEEVAERMKEVLSVY